MRALACSVLLLLAAVGTAPPATAAAEIEGGLSVVDISAPLGYRLSGYYHERGSTAVHDPLLAKALVLRQAEQQAAIVCCDLIGIPWPLTAEVRRRVEQVCGIPAEHVLLSASHTHTGPLFSGPLRQHLHEQAQAKEGTDPREKVDYPAQLVEKLVKAIAEAKAALKPVKLCAGTGKQQGLSFNRRFHMKDGSVVFNPGKLNPNIVRPAGPVDPQVGLLLLRRPGDDRPLASLTVFALHLDTVGGTEYSADFPFHLQQSLRRKLGEEFVSLFGNGTCGDINHIDVSHKRPQKGQDEAKRIGETLAGAVEAALPGLKPLKRPALAVRHQMVDVPWQQVTAEQVAWAEETIRRISQGKVSFLDQVKAHKIKSLAGRSGKTARLPVQAIRLGEEAAIVGLPGEVFVDLGVAIKRSSPFATTLVIELANDSCGYVPTRKAFAEGSYETVNSRVEPGGGEMLVEAAERLLKQLKQE